MRQAKSMLGGATNGHVTLFKRKHDSSFVFLKATTGFSSVLTEWAASARNFFSYALTDFSYS